MESEIEIESSIMEHLSDFRANVYYTAKAAFGNGLNMLSI